MKIELHDKKHYSFQCLDMSRCEFNLWDDVSETEKNLFDAIENKEIFLLYFGHKLQKSKSISDYQNLFEKLGFGEIEITMNYIANLQLTFYAANLSEKQYLTLKTKTWTSSNKLLKT